MNPKASYHVTACGYGYGDEFSLDLETDNNMKQEIDVNDDCDDKKDKDDGELLRFASAMGNQELDMIMQQVMSTDKSEEEQVEEFIR